MRSSGRKVDENVESSCPEDDRKWKCFNELIEHEMKPGIQQAQDMTEEYIKENPSDSNHYECPRRSRNAFLRKIVEKV